jgi:hypothetical protein
MGWSDAAERSFRRVLAAMLPGYQDAHSGGSRSR